MTDRKKPGVACWMAVVVIVVLVGYPLSFGPACWWFSPLEPLDLGYSAIQHHLAPRCYWPMGWLAKHGPQPISAVIRWYGTMRIQSVKIPAHPTGTSWVQI